GYGIETFTLHRLLRAWGEGNKNPTMSPGRGAPATLGEADWLSPLAFTTNSWTVPGGAPDSDYASAGSGSQIVYDGSAAYSPYAFPDPGDDHAPIIADVQLWLDKPATNFGWMLIC